ncbi:Transposable element P transposase [Oopsacas minuta]|uniref:Transposable element P transposase n=1 Tax=Oopsacas minuta TaxID=111878 RepID=A0AAV7K4P0_9METZ|nr:Transposable element P transposase [Oopsacas minuta]
MLLLRSAVPSIFPNCPSYLIYPTVRSLAYFKETEYLLTAKIQNDPLEHHFGLYRQMLGSHYKISFNQILESERRLQLSNHLKVFDLKCYSASSSTEGTISLKEYHNGFADGCDC